MSVDLTASIAETVRAAREAHGLSAAALADRSGVSRAMIAKVERAEAQPTAALLGRLSAALGLTLSELVARAEQSDRRLARADEQPVWTDPETGSNYSIGWMSTLDVLVRLHAGESTT